MKQDKINVGVVGATGVVGEEFLKILTSRKFPVKELRLFASEKSRGQKREFQGRSHSIQELEDDCFRGLDLVFFSSGDDISKEWAPRAVQAGAFAIDNSAAFRLNNDVPLIVPEVNSDQLPPREMPAIIANPNCSTIQLVVALSPLEKHFGLSAVKVATYQAVSGAGRPAQEELITQLANEAKGENHSPAKHLPRTIAHNVIPQIGSIGEDGYCSEERKIRLETRKILNLPHLSISAWTVRVPVMNVHSEAVWVTLSKAVNRSEILKTWSKAEGLLVSEKDADYPVARDVSGQDPVYVGRLHQDPDDPRTWLLWVVSDNLRKGAALNGCQIAEKLFLRP